MNILGIGTDICNSKRIKSLLQKHNRLKGKIFTNKEITNSNKIKKKTFIFCKKICCKRGLFKSTRYWYVKRS